MRRSCLWFSRLLIKFCLTQTCISHFDSCLCLMAAGSEAQTLAEQSLVCCWCDVRDGCVCLCLIQHILRTPPRCPQVDNLPEICQNNILTTSYLPNEIVCRVSRISHRVCIGYPAPADPLPVACFSRLPSTSIRLRLLLPRSRAKVTLLCAMQARGPRSPGVLTPA